MNAKSLPVSTRLQEAFESVQKAMLDLFGLVEDYKNKGNYIPKVSVELLNDPHSDPAVVVDGWLYIMETEKDVEITTIGRVIKKTRPAWYLSYETHNPGVRYYPDGSGEPPSSDVNDCTPAVTESIVVAISTLAEMVIKSRMEGIAEHEMYKNEKNLESI